MRRMPSAAASITNSIAIPIGARTHTPNSLSAGSGSGSGSGSGTQAQVRHRTPGKSTDAQDNIPRSDDTTAKSGDPSTSTRHSFPPLAKTQLLPPSLPIHPTPARLLPLHKYSSPLVVPRLSSSSSHIPSPGSLLLASLAPARIVSSSAILPSPVVSSTGLGSIFTRAPALATLQHSRFQQRQP